MSASLLPYVAVAAAIVFAVSGYDLAAIISGVVGIAAIGPRLIEAFRKGGDETDP